MEELPDRTLRVAWSTQTGSTVHVTLLTADLRRAGPDLTTPGESVRGLVAHSDGTVAVAVVVVVVVVVRGQELHFVKLDAGGVQVVDRVVIGAKPATEDGSEFVHFRGTRAGSAG